MTGFVIDASVAFAWRFDGQGDEGNPHLLDRFEDKRAEVPSLWHLELASALATGERKGGITPARASEFIALIDGLPILIDERTPNVALSSVLELSRRERLSAYDGSYLELAMRRGIPLATKDIDLAQAADRVGVTLLPTA